MAIDNYDNGKILVWSKVGHLFKTMDEKRILAVALQNPNYFLNNLYLEEIERLTEEIYENPNKVDENLKLIAKLNELHDLFKQLHNYFSQSQDPLSTGSFLNPQMERKQRMAGLIKENDNELEE